MKFNIFKFTLLVRANGAFINLVVRNDNYDDDMETLRCKLELRGEMRLSND